MSTHRLTVTVVDLETATRFVRTFYRSPVIVGRAPSSGVYLAAGSVSRHHGAFVFGPGVPQYIDLGSRNGSQINGVPVPPDRPVDVRYGSMLHVGPFRITIGLNVVVDDDEPPDKEGIADAGRDVDISMSNRRRTSAP